MGMKERTENIFPTQIILGRDVAPGNSTIVNVSLSKDFVIAWYFPRCAKVIITFIYEYNMPMYLGTFTFLLSQ